MKQIEPEAGEFFGDFIKRAIKHVNDESLPGIRITFNGTDIDVLPDSNPSDLATIFELKRRIERILRCQF